MLVDNLEDERDQDNVVPIPIPPPVIRLDTVRNDCPIYAFFFVFFPCFDL